MHVHHFHSEKKKDFYKFLEDERLVTNKYNLLITNNLQFSQESTIIQ